MKAAKLNIVIIDDDVNSISGLEILIELYCPSFKVAATAQNIEDGAKALLQYQPHLVFLDVEMPDGTGFDLLQMLGERQFDVVFITAHNQYAINAIKHSALDYLLKPIEIKEFIKTTSAIQSKLGNKQKNYEILAENLKNSESKKLVVSTLKGYEYIAVNEIIRIESERSYARIFLLNGRNILVSKSLSEYQGILNTNEFFRIHNSHLINLKHVVMFIKNDGGYVKMCDDSILPIARSKKELFINLMQQYTL